MARECPDRNAPHRGGKGGKRVSFFLEEPYYQDYVMHKGKGKPKGGGKMNFTMEDLYAFVKGKSKGGGKFKSKNSGNVNAYSMSD